MRAQTKRTRGVGLHQWTSDPPWRFPPLLAGSGELRSAGTGDPDRQAPGASKSLFALASVELRFRRHARAPRPDPPRSLGAGIPRVAWTFEVIGLTTIG